MKVCQSRDRSTFTTINRNLINVFLPINITIRHIFRSVFRDCTSVSGVLGFILMGSSRSIISIPAIAGVVTALRRRRFPHLLLLLAVTIGHGNDVAQQHSSLAATVNPIKCGEIWVLPLSAQKDWISRDPSWRAPCLSYPHRRPLRCANSRCGLGLASIIFINQSILS